MSFIEERIKYEPYLERIMSAEQAAAQICDGMTVCIPDFGFMDNPRQICNAITKRVTQGGERLRLNFIKCANAHEDIDTTWTECGIMQRRMIFFGSSVLRERVNTEGGVAFRDPHLSHVPDRMLKGWYGKIDFAIMSCCGATSDGRLLPSFDQGYAPTVLKYADKILLEISTESVKDLYKLHDVYIRGEIGSRRDPIPIVNVTDRIGSHFYTVDPNKIAGIVITDTPMNVYPMWNISKPSPEVERIADVFTEFLICETKQGRLPQKLPPLQTGAGAVADAVVRRLGEHFDNIEMYSEGIMDGGLQLLLDGKLSGASIGGWSVSEGFLKLLREDIDRFVDKVVIRPGEISNSVEIINRLGVIAMNNALEVDIYGNVNSTNAMGSRMISGIGGSGDYARNAFLTVFFTLSTAKNGNISSIVPFCSHIDHTEHDVDIVVTEYGLADLRDKSPRERAQEMIRISHPDYRHMLKDYYDRALKECGPGNCHTPILLNEALSWHERYRKTGTMKLSSQEW